jgi:Helix-turn-helix domain
MNVIETLTTLSPILCPISVAAQMIGRSERVIYDLIGRGQIEAVKSDGRTLIRVASLDRYAASLPLAEIASGPKRQPQRMRQPA